MWSSMSENDLTVMKLRLQQYSPQMLNNTQRRSERKKNLLLALFVSIQKSTKYERWPIENYYWWRLCNSCARLFCVLAFNLHRLGVFKNSHKTKLKKYMVWMISRLFDCVSQTLEKKQAARFKISDREMKRQRRGNKLNDSVWWFIITHIFFK